MTLYFTLLAVSIMQYACMLTHANELSSLNLAVIIATAIIGIMSLGLIEYIQLLLYMNNVCHNHNMLCMHSTRIGK